jgi:hypothetical protein
MKLYNPFKPHFCQFGDSRFGMRKLSVFAPGWTYLDTNDMRYWRESKYDGSRHTDLAALKRLVADRTESIQRAKNAKKSWRVL